jgi:predicted PurR-regulated permease PerM
VWSYSFSLQRSGRTKWSQTLARPTDAASSSSKSLVLIAFVLAITVLYFGRQVFIPLALAVVFSFLLTPVVSLLEKIRLRRVPAVLAVLTLSFVLVGAVTWGAAKQLVEIMVQLPDYKDNLDTKIQLLQASREGKISKAAATVQDLNKELAAVPGEISTPHLQGKDKEQPTTRSTRPIPVQVAQPQSNLVQDSRALLGPLAGPIETASIVIIFTIFMLVNREDLRNRAIRLAGRGQLTVMTHALDDAGRRLSRYLLLQCLVNAGYGLLFGLALYFVGVPHALLWGVFAGVLRFVPYIGTLIATALPVAMALAVFPGWHQAALTFGAFLVLELTVSNVIEPMLYGAHTGISSLAILVAAVFWATLWGPVGLILSTPLTVCLIVIGRHVPQLKFLEVVLGDEPVLLPEQCFYQRLLAMDQVEARAIAEAHLKENSLESLYESVILPALKLAEQDHHTAGLDDSTRRLVFRSVKELIEDLGDEYAEDLQAAGSEDDAFSGRHQPERPALRVRTACIPASSGADELVATMLAQLLRQAGYRVRVFRPGVVPEGMIMAVSREECGIACISSISPFAVGEARLLCKRLRATISGLQIVMGLWNFEGNAARQRLGPGCSGLVTTTLSEALEQIRRLADSAGRAESEPFIAEHSPSYISRSPAETL